MLRRFRKKAEAWLSISACVKAAFLATLVVMLFLVSEFLIRAAHRVLNSNFSLL